MLPSRINGFAEHTLDGVERYWNGACPFKTRVVDVVSASVPVAERLIIQIVHRMAQQCEDGAIRDQALMLIRHEAMHMKMHHRLNDRLRAQGLPIDELERVVHGEVARVLAFRSRHWQMGYAAALEYLGGMVSSCLLADRVTTLRGADPRMRELYLQHAMDEVEHAHVVPSITRSTRLGYLTRVMPMIHVTFKSVFLTMWFTDRMLKRDGIGFLRRFGMISQGWWWLVFGTILPLLPQYLRFYTRSFVAETSRP